MEKTVYCGTRTLAREAAKELNGKFKDMGKDAPYGERWVVLIEVPDVQEEVHTQFVDTLPEDAVRVLNQPTGFKGEQTLKTSNNKPVRVLWRRSKVTMRLAAHLAKA
ncbi:hypothetical protein pEaSNUABM50_00024 [Erwinia phage pEa_SNUABM_50]|uniref:Uncharacterized protein n=4 Tax=Eneladusvirus BF TaxID=2560751 RepID=A0A7L8ZMS1_9CAUD|nr:hypothetical protein FDH34_gp025 [Serratia phage BF]QOI70963.1 hypothetical protein pEaSNUABM12_00025 [Erwinia phage pEa_SNUABM_12]QOI71508.1 hypothetical protein pEaSNUABM47_00024 [Erwinia phage pEa_SNUABM_47]QOI72048.1 hypothetical protein pEaSNUABM50_00024 [Erwinia phage pEa_SNUABM_50]QXO11171.1 hypothetical protein pEaSNUABM19_00025 [Erwinia phage pEa_SNUABM_19]QXO11719.1 hypothetical protein pEaSNUABM44_00023 [Erwinia phage pEa_SNUABM_44]QXO12270.1 hypothetical protein pEaSNUABM49_000